MEIVRSLIVSSGVVGEIFEFKKINQEKVMVNKKKSLQNASLSSVHNTNIVSFIEVAFVLGDRRKLLSFVEALMFSL